MCDLYNVVSLLILWYYYNTNIRLVEKEVHVMSKDYGYFGDGLDGYVHYKQAFDDIFKENDGLSEDDFFSEDGFIEAEYPEDDGMYD